MKPDERIQVNVKEDPDVNFLAQINSISRFIPWTDCYAIYHYNSSNESNHRIRCCFIDGPIVDVDFYITDNYSIENEPFETLDSAAYQLRCLLD